ncbi:conserved protein of unknown function [Rhodovastum atsumiense]|uniref:DUF4384 domain-containing protein n=1 Tax=Rhodovastum atsumiense TaxID=504468 RepID=A0A5M6IPI5_9PROT|nr:DUF4384 domain-containing protein [Rhodovastum atsumiense]KAA5609867.1 DUF4384 domain-containing protein [Rhodovastum atsumiense]CAH2602432.1 conserved protein of unknown function [Rhodovastum atsumiense]
MQPGLWGWGAQGHSRRGVQRMARLCLALPLLLGACQAGPQAALDAAQPRTAPVRTLSNFNEALRCMDDMFAANGKRDIFITTAGIPDATGLIAAGTKEMFISAVSHMSARSNAFRFVDFDPTQIDVHELHKLLGLSPDFVAPSYYVRGAITQLDSGVLASSVGGSVSMPGFDIAASADRIISIVSVDLNVGKLVTRQILPGISANNTIAVVQVGKGVDTGGLIGKAGLTFSVSLDRSEGYAQAVRNLIDLSTIEVLGKLARVPYWECLHIDATNPAFRTEARQWFDLMGSGERERFVRTGLARAGYLAGDGADLAAAIGHYQADSDLIPTGRIDFDLYYRLLASDKRPSGAPAAVPSAAAPPAPDPAMPAQSPAPPSPALPPRVGLDSGRGPQPAYRVGESITLRVQPDADAYVYCYYQDASGTVARIFPNRFQPDAFIPANQAVSVPPAGQSGFRIRFDHAGSRETILCLAAGHEVGLRLPDALKRQDLEPLPVQALDQVTAGFRAIPGAAVAETRLPIEVTR